jgi:hypothetical protein
MLIIPTATQLEASLHLHALAKLQVQGWRPGAFEFQHLALTAARTQAKTIREQRAK